MNFLKNKPKGFTLIELLVVVSIISLLTSVVLAALGEARAKARDARRLSDLRQVHTALQLYLQDHEEAPFSGDFPDTNQIHSSINGNWEILEDLLSNYIKSLPVDPLNGIVINSGYVDSLGSDDYRYSYSRLDEHSGSFCVSGSNPTHPNCSNTRNYVLDASFEERSRVGNLPISAQFFGMTYELWE